MPPFVAINFFTFNTYQMLLSQKHNSFSFRPEILSYFVPFRPTVRVFTTQKRFGQCFAHYASGGSRGAPPAHAPLRVQILSFWHTNFSKCSRLGSWRPPYEVGAPPTGNPGSATVMRSSFLKNPADKWI